MLTVKHELKTKTLYELSIYHEVMLIGEYERSQQQEINRKKKEINKASTFLLDIYKEHGYFEVRWDGKKRQKSVRVNGNEVGVIPEKYWKGLF